MIDKLAVPPTMLSPSVEVDRLGFGDTSELEPLEETIEQERAVEALEFGLRMQSAGFNIYVSGLSGSGKWLPEYAMGALSPLFRTRPHKRRSSRGGPSPSPTQTKLEATPYRQYRSLFPVPSLPLPTEAPSQELPGVQVCFSYLDSWPHPRDGVFCSLLCPPVIRQMAFSPVSPVRILTTFPRSDTKILPSPMLPVLALPAMVSTTR